MNAKDSAEFVILGAGLAGLAAAVELGEDAIVVERDARPGGLVKTDNHDGYWFDRVLHLLYLPDEETGSFVHDLLGDALAPCSPEAWVAAQSGTVRYPFQMHLGGLPEEVAVRCLIDLASVTFGPARDRHPANFEDLLHLRFGNAMCEEFLFPYNRKMWKRALAELAGSGFQWTITPPDFREVVRGVLDKQQNYLAYNSKGWYPRPPIDADNRGMGILSAALAARALDVRLGHRVTGVDLGRREVICVNGGKEVRFEYGRALCSTLPLPHLLKMIKPSPKHLQELAATLKWNRVVMVAFKIRGPRPKGKGHWRYYADESLIFNRLIYMHEFDPNAAPADGWSLLAEITEPAESPTRAEIEMVHECQRDVLRAGELPSDCEIIGHHTWEIDPAYVVFTHETFRVTEEICAFLTEHDIEILGRYGRWEYSSMGQVIRDGRSWAQNVKRSQTVTTGGNPECG